MVKTRIVFGWAKDIFTIYSTTRVVKIKSKILAVTYVTLVVLVWAAFLRSYELDLRRVYQKTCPARGITLTKVKGVVSTEDLELTDLEVPNPELYTRVWDTEDTVWDSADGFMVATNLIITPNQTRGNCIPTSKFGSCSNSSQCKQGKEDLTSSGIYSGECQKNKCQLAAWCPIEANQIPFKGSKALLENTKSFTVMIKTSVEFIDCEPVDKFRRRNILDNFTTKYLKTCRYDPVEHPYCPIFTLESIVKGSGNNYSQVAILGGVFRVRIEWNCDFDFGSTIKDCLPKYIFSRFDDSDAVISPGYNFRKSAYHEIDRRTMTKYYALKFIVEVVGEGKKFDFYVLVLTIGASIGLFALAPLICDFMFDAFCLFKTLGGPCKVWFSEFTEHIRYQDVNAHLENQNLDNKTGQNFDLSIIGNGANSTKPT